MESCELFNRKIIIFRDDSDVDAILSSLYTSTDTLQDHVFVALEGSTDKRLPSDQFLIKNRDASLMNHFLWENLLTDNERDDKLLEMLTHYIKTGKQFTIENYQFVEDEPFYEYGGEL